MIVAFIDRKSACGVVLDGPPGAHSLRRWEKIEEHHGLEQAMEAQYIPDRLYNSVVKLLNLSKLQILPS